MRIPKNIRDNLHFIIAEVNSQLSSLQRYFNSISTTDAKHILERSGYVYNLKIRIHNSCLNETAKLKKSNRSEKLTFRSLEFIATDLERIAELCRECIKQMQAMHDVSVLRPNTCGSLLERLIQGVGFIENAIYEHDTRLALKIGNIEKKLKHDFNELLKHYVGPLKKNKASVDLISSLFVARSISQMGDSLLNISEALISSNLGQPVNIDRYYSLQASVAELEMDESLSSLKIDAIAETRSGSKISGIINADDNGCLAIFKDGEKRKLKEERQGVESWHEIYPGLAPKILSYKKRGQSASLLIEHLSGFTFEQILLQDSPLLMNEALSRLGDTLKSVWKETRSSRKVPANFMQQLNKRLHDVYVIHPEFHQGKNIICGYKLPAFEVLLEKAREYESHIQVPFSVYIHGDFNVDNIIYDPVEKHINFIDLHRSRYMDYVQDVSVFMVSNYRLQVLDITLRKRIMKLAQDFYLIARNYAHKTGDDNFEIRLALGLARSFATSTRFILDKSLARTMFLRARYLIEKVLQTEISKAHKFRLPLEDIFIA
ncbi:FIG00741077: hypothetical protein [hydrothermal vent metagenome]|uniref:Uncharacterized protein n=1 Tax=hydrothermal vent metagenome TaxID=652676 RepID=A0A3B1BPB2_9ZZZZ